MTTFYVEKMWSIGYSFVAFGLECLFDQYFYKVNFPCLSIRVFDIHGWSIEPNDITLLSFSFFFMEVVFGVLGFIRFGYKVLSLMFFHLG